MAELLHLKYRAFVQTFYKWIIGLTLLGEFLIIRLNIYEITKESALMGTLKLLVASTVPISILIRVIFFIRPRIYSEFDLYEDKLIVHQGKKQKEVLFNNVIAVKISWFSPRFFGGFTLELNSGQKLIFLSVLKNNHLVLENICKKWPEVVPAKKYQKYLRLSQTVEASWDRIQNKIKDWKCWVLKYLVFPMAVAFGLHLAEWVVSDDYNSLYLWLWVSLACWALALSLNHLEERIINQNLVDGQVDSKIESIVGKSIMISYYSLSIVILSIIVYLH